MRLPYGLLLMSLLGLLGCGGGGSSISTSPRAGDKDFSRDAKVLAARVADGPWIPAEKAAMFDADLTRIRTEYPQVANIHTVGDYTLNELLIAVRLDAPWLVNWEKGTLTTGEPSLDSLLNTYRAASVQSSFSFEGREWFVLTFAVSLNTRALVPLFQSASKSIAIAEANGYGGDGDRITFEQVGNSKQYTLSRGWGDCPAGCIERHFWTFTFAPDGSLSLEESGTPLPEGGRL